jgi:hypothetical protein
LQQKNPEIPDFWKKKIKASIVIDKLSMILISIQSWFSLFPKVYKDHRHIITAFAHGSSYVGAQTRVQPVFAYFLNSHLPLHLKINIVHNLLVSVELPNSIASHHNKINFTCDLLNANVWECCNCLFFWRQTLVLLVCEVTKRSRKI